MNCEEIKKIIPKYYKHQANDAEIKIVEEHLCICHHCRTELGELMDKKDDLSDLSKEETKSDGIKGKVNIKNNLPKIKIISEEEVIPDIQIPTDINSNESIFTDDNAQENSSLTNGNNVNPKMEYFSASDSGQFMPEDTGKNNESEDIGENVRISFEDEFGKYGIEDDKSEETTIEESVINKISDISLSRNIEAEDLENEVFLTQKKSKGISEDLDFEQKYDITSKKIELFEYISLILGIIVLIFVVYLLMRG